MSGGPDGGGRRKHGGAFLSAHRCPEVDLLPHHSSETKIPPPSSVGAGAKNPEFTCTGQSEADYLVVTSACRPEEDEEEEGTISDWSEEDLTLHFSPSVINPSDDEESEPEATFECVDVTVETVAKDQEREGPKMVPKRQIQLKKKDSDNMVKGRSEKLQVKDGTAHSEASANEIACPVNHQRPDLLLRQHSMPASLHTHSTPSSDIDSCRVYRGLVAGAGQGYQVGGSSKQRLQKSFSLDETKTKMASCIIKSVLSKKMQAEQNNCKPSRLRKNPAVVPSLAPPPDQQRAREGGGAEVGGGVFKAPVHVVRDMRSLVKNTYSLSFSAAPTTTPQNSKTTNFKVIGQEESPPPSYQQAVGVKAQDGAKKSAQGSAYSSSTTGHVSRVAASFSNSQTSNHSNRFTGPITRQRRGSEPIINRHQEDDGREPVVLLDPPTNSPVSSDRPQLCKLERAGGVSHPEGSSLLPPSVVSQPPACPPSKPRHPEGIQPLLSAQEQSSKLGVSSQFALSSSQQIFHPCFYTPTALPAFSAPLPPHMRKVSYVHGPLSYVQTQLQPVPPAPTLHLLRRPEESRSRLTGTVSDHEEQCLPPHTRTPEQRSNGNTATQEQHEQHFLYQGFLPAKGGADQLPDIRNPAAAPGAPLSDPAPCQMLDPNVRCFYVDMPPQSQRKMLLDPETGQYVQVFLPASTSASGNSVLPVSFANPASFTPSAMKPAPAVLSVMQFQPTIGVSSLYAPPFLSFPLPSPAINFTHTAL